jgi:hypothetical protein
MVREGREGREGGKGKQGRESREGNAGKDGSARGGGGGGGRGVYLSVECAIRALEGYVGSPHTLRVYDAQFQVGNDNEILPSVVDW